MNKNERMAEFLCTDTEAALRLIALGEEVSAGMLRIAYERMPGILDRIINMDFKVQVEVDFYSGDTFSEAGGIYDFLRSVYGKDEITRKILARPSMWKDFLPFIELEKAEKQKFAIQLLEEKRFGDAALFVSGTKLSDIDINMALVDEFFAHAKDIDEDGKVRICGFKYLMSHGCWYCQALYDYIFDEDGNLQTSAIEEALAYPSGLEALQKLADEKVNDYLKAANYL